MELVKLGKRGQVSIPRGVLRRLGIVGEQTLLVDTTTDGSIILRQAGVYPLEIYGEEGAILLDPKGLQHKFGHWDDWKRLSHQMSPHEAFARQIDHFIGALDGTPPQVVTNADGLKAQILIEEIYRAADGERPATVVA